MSDCLIALNLWDASIVGVDHAGVTARRISNALVVLVWAHMKGRVADTAVGGRPCIDERNDVVPEVTAVADDATYVREVFTVDVEGAGAGTVRAAYRNVMEHYVITALDLNSVLVVAGGVGCTNTTATSYV